MIADSFYLNFHYFSLDIWGDNKKESQGVIGYTQKIGGICSETKYSVIEWSGFAQIQNAAHELGHRYFQLEVTGLIFLRIETIA
jgi:hypothetical protein